MMTKADRRLFQQLLCCETSVRTVELSRTLQHSKFPIPLSLADTEGVKLHQTQKSNLRSGH